MSNFQAGNSGVSAALEESVEESSQAGSAPLANVVCCARSIQKCSTSGKKFARTSWLSPFNDLRAAINRDFGCGILRFAFDPPDVKSPSHLLPCVIEAALLLPSLVLHRYTI